MVNAKGGNDYIVTGAGDDLINGGWGNDRPLGGRGNDVIDGGVSNDRLIGGEHNDTLTGGAGADTFVFAAGDGRDVITDFDAAEGDRLLLLDLDSYTFKDMVGSGMVHQEGADLYINTGTYSIYLEDTLLAGIENAVVFG